MTSAKEEILYRIRRANSQVSPSTRESEYAQIERQYRDEPAASRDDILECFIDRLHDYGSGVHRCSESSISTTIASVLAEKSITRMLVSAGVPPAWRPEDVHFIEDATLSYADLDAQPGVLTGCAVAIALTGSIILSHNDERRALTLIPDYHLCVVFEDQVTETVPEAIRKLTSFGTAPITTIAGPSATADIEMTRIKGVHGPRFLDVILAGR